MPIYMRIGKLRGSTSKDAMPIGPVPHVHAAGQRPRPRPRFDAGDEVTPETLVEKGLIKNTKTDVKLLGDGELTKKLTVRVHALLGDRAREDRGGRRHRRAAARAEGAEEARKRKAAKPRGRGRGRAAAEAEPEVAEAEDAAESRRGARRRRSVLLARERLARPRAAPARALHGGDPRALPPRLVDPGAGRRPDGDRATSAAAGGTILGLLNLFSGSALSRFSLFALGIMPYVTASIILQLMTVVDPDARAAAEGGRGGLREDQPVHALPDRRARRGAGDRLRVPLQAPGRAANVNAGRLVIIILTLTAGHDAADVDGRADHEARHRQRHLAPDLRVDPRLRARRHQRLDQRRHDRAALLPDHRARRSSSRSSSSRRASGGSRSSTRGGWSAAADRGRLDLHAAAREHGRRHPGHLRRRDHGVPADDRPVRPADAGLRQPALPADELAVPAASRPS